MNKYVILNSAGILICEEMAEQAHIALRQAKERKSDAVTAIVKKQWEVAEKLQDKWVKTARRVKA